MLVLIRRTQRGPRELAGQVERRETRQAGGIAGVGLDDLPGSVVATPLDRRRFERDPGSGCGVVRLGIGILRPSRPDKERAGRPIQSG